MSTTKLFIGVGCTVLVLGGAWCALVVGAHALGLYASVLDGYQPLSRC